MKKLLMPLLLVMLFTLAACGNQGTADKEEGTSEVAATTESEENKEQTITYLGEEYTVPADSDKIVTASQEAMEDAAILGVKPIGAIATGGAFPEYLGDSMSEAKEIGDKRQPNSELLLQMDPDVILGTSKFQPEVVESLNKVATMIPISHISTDWKENLLLLAKLSDKTEEAETIIEDYEKEAAEGKEHFKKTMSDKEVVMVRIRGGNFFVYSPDVYFNPVLYNDLGLPVPEEIQASKSQEMISLEKLAEMNPDYLFVQFEEGENADSPQALEDLKGNSIFKSITAVKNDDIFYNSVPPLAAGGTALSKTEFLKVVMDKLAH
ncbi:ABC transporter substrate-binding protein [Bacillus sp. CH30_1T]|uniref:ABC transporter substrate-binding protein n=1 Tax=Bacillus sp. CH30_1T TaxID=2604836 RepID=UPI0011ED9298|nr:ABC transporter substrate-binding protein [Bacillus sp. CH30_1T]KAA0563534.1 ABC transporter substrate-binding protein [Bacillus sp. CH30_1T]